MNIKDDGSLSDGTFTESVRAKFATVDGLELHSEAVIDGHTWYRISLKEYKVHLEGTDPDAVESETVYVDRIMFDVLDQLECNEQATL